MQSHESLARKLDSLVIFRHLLSDPLIAALKKLSQSIASGSADINAYGEFVSALYAGGGNLTSYIFSLITEDDNLYVRRKASGEKIPDYIEKCLDTELDIFAEAASLTAESVAEKIDYSDSLASWETDGRDIKAEYRRRVERLGEYGYGIYAKYTSFVVKDGALTPVKYPDKICIDDLKDYETERGKVIANTRALISGKPSQNVLLAGDAGTGKSSTVKAVANFFAPQGLRLVQITKKQLHDLPALLDELSSNPLKFIIFIDDLSFSSNDDDFGALKAALEGSVSAKSSNTAIYVTSNRRHLVKESFGDRDGNELHVSDTIQEITSLSDRFGLTVIYSKPDKKIYLDIVLALADQHGILCDRGELCERAETFAIRKGGRSPRAAKQFIDGILAEEGIK